MSAVQIQVVVTNSQVRWTKKWGKTCAQPFDRFVVWKNKDLLKIPFAAQRKTGNSATYFTFHHAYLRSLGSPQSFGSSAHPQRKKRGGRRNQCDLTNFTGGCHAAGGSVYIWLKTWQAGETSHFSWCQYNGERIEYNAQGKNEKEVRAVSCSRTHGRCSQQ